MEVTTATTAAVVATAVAAVIDRCRALRLLSGAAALLAIIVGTLGCSSSSSSAVTSASTDSATRTSLVSATTTVSGAVAGPTAAGPVTVPAAPPAGTGPAAAEPAAGQAPQPVPKGAAETAVPVVAIDAIALLQTAMDTAAPGYHYHSTVTVGGTTVLEADGDRIGDGTRVGVVRDGVTVQYIITPSGTWVQLDGGEWDLLDTPAATADPINALRSPVAATVASVDGTAVHLSVSVPAASLGLVGDATAVLAVVVDSGNLTGVVYSTTVDGQPATVETTVGPVIDGTPVVAPV